jgi:hypothetical protein
VGNGVQELPAVADGMNAEFLQVIATKSRQDFCIHGIVAERLLVLHQSEAP